MLKTCTNWLTLSFARSVLIGLIFLIPSTLSLYGQEEESVGTLPTRLNEILDNVEETRSILKNIVVTINNEGVPGWDKILIAVDVAEGTIQATRDKINTLTDLLEHNTFPFPSTLRTDRHQIRVGNQGGIFSDDWQFTFPHLTGRYPNFPTPFPNVAEKIASFLNLVDQPLSGLKDELLDFESEINSRLALAKLKLEYKYNSPGFDTTSADYFYHEFIRFWLGHPIVGLASALVKERKDLLKEKCKSISQQDIAIVGEGGNLSFIMVALSHLFSIWDLIDVFIQNVGSTSTGAEVTASYYRLDHIHTDIAVVQDSLDSHIIDFHEWKELSMRTRIEINLAGHGDHPHPIAIFQLPAQFGGYLELARDIVVETISNMIAAGQNVHSAQNYLDKGNDKFVVGEYKKSYKYYSKAYDEATKLN